MSMSEVYYADLHSRMGENLPQKLQRLMRRAGADRLDFQGKLTAIKISVGEPGNLSYVHPAYARAVAGFVRERGGIPFLTDCNTLYAGRRKHAVEHMEAAYENGFSPLNVGCQFLVADGLLGKDETLVPVQGEYVKQAKIGTALMDADIVLSLTHFKGHECTGFGGTLKNIGMGGGSRAGKEEMHNYGKPRIRSEKCVGCGNCVQLCGQDAITLTDGKAQIDQKRCKGCGHCILHCPVVAIRCPQSGAEAMVSRKIAEYTLAVLKDRPQFHVSVVTNVSPLCDCYDYNDVPMVPDVGLFASFDPVALDQACADAVNAQAPLPGSELAALPRHEDHFTAVFPSTDWRVGLEHAERIGLGSRVYQRIDLD